MVIQRAREMERFGKVPVINYAVEQGADTNAVFREYVNLYESLPSNYRVALKLSSVNFEETTIAKIVEMFLTKNVQLVIDAEHDELDATYQANVNSLLSTYNTEGVNIFKTYQMYRRDALKTLCTDLDHFGENLGVKMVRGAYWNSERHGGHLFDKKGDTDISYNKGIMTIYQQPVPTILATHNTESINLGQLLNSHGGDFEFGHLMGMKEHKYAEMEGVVNVYIPYGPYSEMVPYLGRRLYENIDTLKYMF